MANRILLSTIVAVALTTGDLSLSYELDLASGAMINSLFGDKQLKRNQNSAITKDIKHCLALYLLIDGKRISRGK